MPARVRYLLNGLCVDSDVPLGHSRRVPDGRPADLVVRFAGYRPVPPDLDGGQLLQGVAGDGTLLCTTTRDRDGGVLVRLHGVAEFEIAADLRHVRVFGDPASEPEMLGILTAGHLVATVLALRGETVLHASAVEVDGVGVAFVADSGGGKSTLAALCCARGARFVTDDVLRLRVGPGGATCWPGATENRLRRDVADLFGGPGAVTRTTADGRTAWSPPGSARAECRLAAVVLVRPERARNRLDLVELGAGRAVVELTRRPRILGWCDPDIAVATFRDLTALVRAVPVYAAAVPWGPPFDAVVVDELLARCLGRTGRTVSPGTPRPAG